MRVPINSGKYEYLFHPTGASVVLRHGEAWRDTTGDNLIYCLAYELNEARERIAELEAQLNTE